MTATPPAPPSEAAETLASALRASRLRAILFDMDGVLADSEPFMVEATRRMFRERHGVDPQPADFLPFFGTGEAGFFGGVARALGVELDFGPDRLRIYDHYRVAIGERAPLLHGEGLTPLPLVALPGARELVLAAREAGLRVAVATSASLLKATITLERIGIPPPLFDAVVTAGDITRNKPDPEVFLVAASRVGAAPRDCLVVEDSPSGARAGRAAGMRVLGLRTSGFGEAELRGAGATHVLEGLEQIPAEVLA